MLDKIKLPTHVSFAADPSAKHRAKLVLEPLHPGYGVTLGNSLRRILLASLPGAAITAVKIKGAEHEFSTLDGVKEDAISMILNLKKVRLICHSDEPVTLSLEKKGEGKVTAADFSSSDQVEVVTPTQPIATITDKDVTLSMDVTVERGRGYVPVEDREKEELPIGTIALDAIYTPVKNVSMDVSSARVGQITNFDKLTLEVETDGTLTPKEAVERAAQLLIDHLGLFTKDLKEVSDTEKRTALPEPAVATLTAPAAGTPTGEPAALTTPATPPSEADKLEMPVESLDLSTRTLNALSDNDVKKVKDLVKMTEQELADLQGLGGKALAEISKALKNIGLTLAGGLGAPKKAA